MPVYRLIRHVIFCPRTQETREVWGIDGAPPAIPVASACSPLLLLPDGDYVSWGRMMEWLSFASTVGYTLVSGYEKLSPYSTMIIQG